MCRAVEKLSSSVLPWQVCLRGLSHGEKLIEAKTEAKKLLLCCRHGPASRWRSLPKQKDMSYLGSINFNYAPELILFGFLYTIYIIPQNQSQKKRKTRAHDTADCNTLAAKRLNTFARSSCGSSWNAS